jgi:excisionase family DNA binding protein
MDAAARHNDAGSHDTLLLTKGKLAQALSVSPRTIEKWVAARRVPVMRFGRRCVRFDLAEVREALNRFRIEAIAS